MQASRSLPLIAAAVLLSCVTAAASAQQSNGNSGNSNRGQHDAQNSSDHHFAVTKEESVNSGNHNGWSKQKANKGKKRRNNRSVSVPEPATGALLGIALVDPLDVPRFRCSIGNRTSA